MMKLGKLVKCLKLYLMMGVFGGLIGCDVHNDVIVYGIFGITSLLMVRTLFTKYRGAKSSSSTFFEALNLYYHTYGAT